MATTLDFKYQLETGSKKFRCPACGKKRFVRYVDNETGQYLPEDIGRCDRELSCGYHKKPNDIDGLSASSALYAPPPQQEIKKPCSTLPFSMIEATERNFTNNTFVKWLGTLPGWDMNRAEAVARRYHVGTGSKDVNGWAIFWQVDNCGKVRSGKMMAYDDTGHRLKDGYTQDWIHSKLIRSGKLENFELVQCFFGLHLLDDKPIAIVESEKTAIIASQYLPQFTWMAAGQLNGINEYKMQPLKGLKVVLFPDIGCFEKWNDKALELSGIAEISVSDLLEKKAPEQHKGFDLADYLIGYDLRDFSPYGWNPFTGEIFDSRGYPAEWDVFESAYTQ